MSVLSFPDNVTSSSYVTFVFLTGGTVQVAVQRTPAVCMIEESFVNRKESGSCMYTGIFVNNEVE